MKMYTLITVLVLATGAGVAAGQTLPARGQGRGPGRGAAATRGPTADQRIEQREANQEKRIEQGVKRGQLTPDEIAKLQGLETNIQAMEKNFEADGKLTKDEAAQIRKALNEASLQIWAERHDTEGKQMPVVRLGKEVFALDELTNKIESGAITKAEARQFLGDFHKMVNIKHRLATEDLTAEQRTKLQGEYNDLLNKYFTVKAPAATKAKP